MTDLYGVREVNPLSGADRAAAETVTRTVSWDTPGLKVHRLRLLSDPGLPWWDVSYCTGCVNGEHVNVELPFSQLPKRGMRAAIVKYAKRYNVYARGMGILDNISTLC